MTSFADLKLSEPLLRALNEEGYTTPTPIQAGAIPFLLQGRDLLGLAQTGTGKTAAFALPILHRLSTHRHPAPPRGARVLVLAPTRELASQIDASFVTYARHMRLSHTVVFGGVGQGRQVDAMRRGVDVLVAAPGRLLDLIGQGHIDLSTVEVLVLDEADRMLDMGFVHDSKAASSPMLPPRSASRCCFPRQCRAAIQPNLPASLVHNPATRRSHTARPRQSRSIRADRRMFVDDGHNKVKRRSPMLMQSASGRLVLAFVFTLMKHDGEQTRRVQLFKAEHFAPRRSTATSRRARANGRWPASGPAR